MRLEDCTFEQIAPPPWQGIIDGQAAEIERLSTPAGAARVLLSNPKAVALMAEIAEEINDARASFPRIIGEALRALAGQPPV